MPLDQVLSPASKLSMLQDLLNLVLLVFINYYWWSVGSHPIVPIGLQQSYVKDVMYASQHLPIKTLASAVYHPSKLSYL